MSQVRKNIIELLHCFASEEQQLDYERNVPHTNVPEELICMWFNDLYHPEDRLFSSCFTPEELTALDEFHRFYKERVDRLPDSRSNRIRTWLASPVWREVMERAQQTLERISV